MWRAMILEAIKDAACDDVDAQEWLETDEARGIMSFAEMGRNVEPFDTLWRACFCNKNTEKGVVNFIRYLEMNLNGVGG